MINCATIELVKHFEGLSLEPYRCPAGYITVGYGHVLTFDRSRSPKEFATITEARAEELLRKDLTRAALQVEALTTVRLNANQLGALSSWVFNLGAHNFRVSTLRRVLNEGDFDRAVEEMQRWVYAGGVKLRGLVLRRAAEANLFETPV